MAQGGVTVTGLKEALDRVKRFPDTLVAQLSEVASQTAHAIAADAARRLMAQTNAKKTAASIVVIDEAQTKHQFVVDEAGHPDDPDMLPIWLEHGTRHMAAKPHMRPAGDAAAPQYEQQMRAATEHAAKDLVE